MAEDRPFWERPLETLNEAEWEALCDRCGRCCLVKLEDEDTGEIFLTSVICALFDTACGGCSDYARRFTRMPDCLRITPETVGTIPWLPPTCAYRLRHEGRPLPSWHPLLSGDPDSVRRAGVSVLGDVISETAVAEEDLPQFIREWPTPDGGNEHTD